MVKIVHKGPYNPAEHPDLPLASPKSEDPAGGHAYGNRLGTTELQMIEQSAFNFWTMTGRPMKVPPSLFDAIKAKGVNMAHIEADPSLEH